MTETSRVDRRRERRRTILEAAVSLFARYGFAATGVSDIARAAGISHGTVFLYFSSKEDLFRAAVLEPLQEFAGRSVQIMEGEGSPLERLRCLVWEQVSEIAAERSYLQMVQLAVAQSEAFGDLATEISSVLDDVVVRLARVIEAGMEAGELEPSPAIVVAASYIAFLNGIGLVILSDASAPIWEQLNGQALRLFAPSEGDRDDPAGSGTRAGEPER